MNRTLLLALSVCAIATTSLARQKSAHAQILNTTSASAAFHPSTYFDFNRVYNDGSSTYNIDTVNPVQVSSPRAMYVVASTATWSIGTTVYLHNNGELTSCALKATDVVTGSTWSASNSTTANGMYQMPINLSLPPLSNTYVMTSVICTLGKLVGTNYAVVYGAQ